MLEDLKKKLMEAKTQEEKGAIWASYTEEEKRALMALYNETSGSDNGEIEDEKLEAVSGGFGFWPWQWFS